jgi:hypothetical protein
MILTSCIELMAWMTSLQHDLRQDSLLGAFGSAWSQDDSRLDLNDELFSKATSIMQLADARILFKPFLQSIGLHVEGVRPTAMMKKFGGSLSLQGQLEVIRIQIVNSERHRRKEKSKKRRLIDFNAVPAFLWTLLWRTIHHLNPVYYRPDSKHFQMHQVENPAF